MGSARRPLIKFVFQRILDHRLGLVAVVSTDLFSYHMAEGWELGAVHMSVAVPKLRADQRLGTVQENLLDCHTAGGHRLFTLGHQLFQ